MAAGGGRGTFCKQDQLSYVGTSTQFVTLRLSSTSFFLVLRRVRAYREPHQASIASFKRCLGSRNVIALQ
eukprot:scaffold1372_cov144-Skeletonema_menzelii.AAC.4